MEETLRGNDEEQGRSVPVRLTPKAAEHARQVLAREGLQDSGYLRVGVVGGGCSGMQYSLKLDRERKADDWVFEDQGVRLVIDEHSLKYLRGTTIDYVSGLHGAGFKFVNPNAERTCGCGSSFSVSQ